MTDKILKIKRIFWIFIFPQVQISWNRDNVSDFSFPSHNFLNLFNRKVLKVTNYVFGSGRILLGVPSLKWHEFDTLRF